MIIDSPVGLTAQYDTGELYEEWLLDDHDVIYSVIFVETGSRCECTPGHLFLIQDPKCRHINAVLSWMRKNTQHEIHL